MTEASRQAAVEAMEAAWQKAQREDKWNSYDETIRGLLSALFDPQTTPCPECDTPDTQDAGWRCPNPACADGTISTPALAVLRDDLEQVGYFHHDSAWPPQLHFVLEPTASSVPAFAIRTPEQQGEK